MIMVVDAVRLILFPAMMAFAASSDLLTMTISNRVSLVLLGGFFILAAASGMTMMEVFSNLGAAGIVLVVAAGFFVLGRRFVAFVLVVAIGHFPSFTGVTSTRWRTR